MLAMARSSGARPTAVLAAASLVDAADTLGVEGVPKMAASSFVLVWAVLLSTMYGKSPRLVRLYEKFLKYTVWGIVVLLLWVLLKMLLLPRVGRLLLRCSSPECRGEEASLSGMRDIDVCSRVRRVGMYDAYVRCRP